MYLASDSLKQTDRPSWFLRCCSRPSKSRLAPLLPHGSSKRAQVLVWSPGQALLPLPPERTTCREHGKGAAVSEQEAREKEAKEAGMLPEGRISVVRLKGHEGVIFR